jgi:protein-tyrosine phosphatase
LLRVLVVCAANICRSPLAAAVLAARLPAGSARITSAGVRALSGNAADPIVVELARERGYGDLSGHRSQPLLSLLLNQNDLVLCMERGQRDQLLRERPTMTGRIRLYADQPPTDIADPVGRARVEYEACLGIIEAAAAQWPARLAQLGLIAGR